jgi:hypothetical protein
MADFRIVHISGTDPITSWPKVLDFLKQLRNQNQFPICLVSVSSICDQLLRVKQIIHKLKNMKMLLCFM